MTVIPVLFPPNYKCVSSFFFSFSDEVLSDFRSEASRLAEENGVLRQRLAALKEEDLKETREELM